MKNIVIRLFTGPDKQSHFDEIIMPLKDEREVTRALQGGKNVKGVSFQEWKPIKATGVYLSEIDGPSKRGWHNAPRRQFLFTLQGEWEIVTSDGGQAPISASWAAFWIVLSLVALWLLVSKSDKPSFPD